MNFANLCPGCMRELKSKTNLKCPHCGFDAASYKQNTRCLPINTILAGKYLVGKVLGEGGFGITYIGFDLNMEVPVAIKEYFPVELVSRDTTTMHGDRVLSMSGEKSVTYKAGLKKYVAEAQNVSKFANMSGVVSVKDFFYENDTAYIVMEYIDGISLKEYLKQKNGRLTETETLRLIQPVLEALEQIHASGIVHRDISPDNIMLTFKTDGSVDSVKLIDFGAARMTEKNDQHSLTIILKHGYAPEEQYRTHGEQGPWTDVYAICAAMYRMLTGVTPEPAMDRIFQDKLKRPSELGISVSKAVEEALMEGLAVKKEDRIAGIAELREALNGSRKRKGNAVRMRRTGILAGIGAVFLIGMVGIGMFIGNRGTADIKKEENIIDGAANNKEIPGETVPEDVGISETIAEPVVLEEEEIGEQIVFYHPQNAISGVQNAHTLIRMPDGSVTALGENSYGQCQVEDWDQIASVAASSNHSLGLRSDGMVYAAGNNDYGQCGVDAWNDIVAIAAGWNSSFGLRSDGTMVACGSVEEYTEIYEWSNIKAITVSQNERGLIALDESGTIHTSGFVNEIPEITEWTDVAALGVGIVNEAGQNLIGIKEDGTVVRCVLETYSEAQKNRPYTGAESWTDIQQIYPQTPVLGVKKDGTVVYADNAGVIREAEAAEIQSWDQMEAVWSAYSSGDFLLIGLRKDGTVVQYRENHGNAELADMNSLQWVQIDEEAALEDGIIAGTQDGRILTYGIKNGLDGIENSIKSAGISAENVKDVIGNEGVLSTDGRFRIFSESGSGEIAWSEDGVRQAVMLWSGYYLGQWHSSAYALLMEDGHVKIQVFGDDLEGSGIDPEKHLLLVKTAEQWENVVQIEGGSNGFLLGLREDGTIVSTVNQYESNLETVSGITQIAERYGDILGITTEGTVLPIVTSTYAVEFGRTQVNNWKNVVDIAMGQSHVVGLLEDGTVAAAGSNHAGQCDVAEWNNIVSLTAGKNCTLGITADGELKMAGSLY